MTTAPVRVRKRPSLLDNAATGDGLRLAELHDRIINMKVVHLRTAELSPPTREYRKRGSRQKKALKASVLEFGITKPILVDKDRLIVAGYGVWLAAKDLGIETVPVLFLDDLTPEQIRLYRLADNQIATLAEWDDDLLRLEFGELSDLSLDLDLDLELTGFSTGEIDQILLSPDASAGSGEGETDDVELPEGPAVSRLGDVWTLDDHRLLCGNSLEEASYLALMAGELAQIVVADGPYNVPVRGHVSGRKDAKEFAFASGEMSSPEFIDFQRSIFRHLVRHSTDGSIHYQFMSWHHAFEILSAGREEYTELKNILVWNKTNASRGFYRSQHELIFVFKSGTADHICTFGIEKGARWRSNVLTYPGCNTFRSGRDEDLAAHPTVKNLSLIADLLRDCSKRNGIVLDPFGGAGTTLAAAELTGRRARLIEIDPLYVDVTIHRWEKQTGRTAVLEVTGQTFAEVADKRGIASLEGGEVDE